MADQKHTYAYRAINDEGVTLTGDIEAESAEQARQALLGRGLMPTEVTRRDGPLKSKRFQKFFQKPVTYKQIILFSKQFRTLFNAGVSITQLLGILQTQTENPTLKAATADIAQQVSTGGTLYNAFRSHPDIFSPLYCSMIRAGEFSGSMGDVLDRLTYLLEHENKIRNDVKSALRYPKIVLITLAGAFFFLLNWVVPSFAKLFVNAKIELPWPTRMALAMNTALSDYWYLLLASACSSGCAGGYGQAGAATCGPGRCSPSRSSARSSRCRSWPALPPSFPSSSVAASVSSIHWIFFQRPSTMPRWSGNSPPSRKNSDQARASRNRSAPHAISRR